jgi:hypothetical protein
VELLSGGLDKGKAYAALVLRNLTLDNNANKAAMVAAGAILPLLELLSSGSDVSAAGALPPLKYRCRYGVPGYRYRCRHEVQVQV